MLVSEAVEIPSVPLQERLPETFTDREVTRQIDRHLHVPGAHVANFLGDVGTMLRDGHFYGLGDREFRFLAHVLKCCIRPADNAEGGVVSLSDRQFGRFVGIRRAFLKAAKDPSNLITHLQSKFRVSTATNTTEIDQ